MLSRVKDLNNNNLAVIFVDCKDNLIRPNRDDSVGKGQSVKSDINGMSVGEMLENDSGVIDFIDDGGGSIR